MSDSVRSSSSGPRLDVDAVVVGAGFAGMYMLHRLRSIGLTATVFEAGTDVGGTWYWNRYPGARCDVESVHYCYSFSPELDAEWTWTERYPTQPEILRYARFVADRFDLRRDIVFETRVEGAEYDDDAGTWTVRTDGGHSVTARYCIMGTGCLSVPKLPEVPNLDSFRGDVFHTGQWPHDGVDFTGRRVGVIGTGSSGIQAIPEIAAQAEHVYVFQRTPNFSVPARNAPLAPEVVADIKRNYPSIRERALNTPGGHALDYGELSALEVDDDERRREYERRWDVGGAGLMLAYRDLRTDERSNETLAEFVREKIHELVADPEVADLLSPTDHAIGTKRICVDTGYYETFNQPNVTLVDVKASPIEEFRPTGVRTASGDYEIDSLVLASGFDAMTGALMRMDIRGRNGVTLQDKWEHGPRTYLGLAVEGFPNLFIIAGPGSPSVLSNMIMSIEQHVDWIADCLVYLRDHGRSTIEAMRDAEDTWVQHVNDVADQTLLPKANSWYTGANVPGKPRVFMPYVGGVNVYRGICDDVAASGYRGFELRAAPDAEFTVTRSEVDGAAG